MIHNPFANAQWIWRSDWQCQNVYVNFEETFTGGEGCWQLYISADQMYAVYVNDTYIPARQWSDTAEHKTYDVLDLTEAIQSGTNHLTIIGYCQNMDSSTYKTAILNQPSAALIYALYQDEQEILCSSDDTLCYHNPYYLNEGVGMVSGQLGFTFEYDATACVTDVCKADVIDKSKELHPRPVHQLEWLPPVAKSIVQYGQYEEVPCEKPMTGLRVQNARLTQGKAPTGWPISCPASTYMILDLLKETVGVWYLDIELSEESDVLVSWGEHLDDGHVRAVIDSREFTARFHAGPGRHRFMHPFLRMGCRYLQLHVAAPAVVHDTGLIPTVYPLNEYPVDCGSELRNRIYQIGIDTLRACMHEHYEDCPWREQALYTMDSRNQMLCGYYAFHEYAFPKASLELMASSLREDHLLELCSPGRVSVTIPIFSAVFCIQLYEYAIYSGDTALLVKLLPVARDIADGFLHRRDHSGLAVSYTESQHWNFYEWQDGLSGAIGKITTPEEEAYDAPLQGFISLCLKAVADSLRLLGDTETAISYEKEQQALNQKIHQTFWDGDELIYYSYIRKMDGYRYHTCELTQSLMLLNGVCPAEYKPLLREKLINRELLEITLSHSIFKYESLLEDPSLKERIFTQIDEIWGYMLDCGATTFWETQIGSADFTLAGSLCHGWSAVPVYLYHKYLKGESTHE